MEGDKEIVREETIMADDGDQKYDAGDAGDASDL